MFGTILNAFSSASLAVQGGGDTPGSNRNSDTSKKPQQQSCPSGTSCTCACHEESPKLNDKLGKVVDRAKYQFRKMSEDVGEYIFVFSAVTVFIL